MQAAAHEVAVLVAGLMAEAAPFLGGEAQRGEAAAQRLGTVGELEARVGERRVGVLDDPLLLADVVDEEGAARDVGGADLALLLGVVVPEGSLAVPHLDLSSGRGDEDHPGLRVPTGGGHAVAAQGLGAQLSVGDGHGELLDREELRSVEHLGFGTKKMSTGFRPHRQLPLVPERVGQPMGRRVPGGKDSEPWHHKTLL